MAKGVSELLTALSAFKDEWPSVDTIAVTVRVTDGHMLTVRLSGPDLIEIERDDGWIMVVPTHGPDE